MPLSTSRSRVFVVVCLILTVSSIALSRSLEAAPETESTGPEKWVDGPENVQLGSARSYPDVAVNEERIRTHVWTESGIGGSQAGEIAVRRWDGDGNPLEDPQQVNITTDDIQRHPRVAASNNATALIIWQSWELAPGASAERVVIRSRLYETNIGFLSPEQKISTVPTNFATDAHADVAALRTADTGSTGGFAVVWTSANSDGSDTGNSIQGCVISTSGVPGAQFQVNSRDNAGGENYPSVTELKDGGFLVAWSVGNQIWGRRFNAAGGPIGNDFQISTTGSNARYDVDAAIGWDGKILVAWSDAEADGGTNGKEIYGRLFGPDLTPLGPDFRVNSLTAGAQEDPKVAEAGPAGFLMVWQSFQASGADLGESIEARLVTGPNQFAGPQFQLNVWDNDNAQGQPGAHGWYGHSATTWRSLTWNGNPPPNNQNEPFIIGRDIEDCIFCDDFDWFDPGGTGNLWRWTLALGASP